MGTRFQTTKITSDIAIPARGQFTRSVRPFGLQSTPASPGAFHAAETAAAFEPGAHQAAEPAPAAAKPGANQSSAPATVQRAAAAHDFGQAAVEAPSLRPQAKGRPLPAPIQAKMEGAFGTSFSAVRVHEGAAAPSIGANAFTRGNDLHFAPGKFQPHSRRGQALLGHELAHVVQQRSGRVAAPQGKGVPVNADPRLEGEAEALGARVAAGRAVRVSGSPVARGRAIQGGAPPAADGRAVQGVAPTAAEGRAVAGGAATGQAVPASASAGGLQARAVTGGGGVVQSQHKKKKQSTGGASTVARHQHGQQARKQQSSDRFFREMKKKNPNITKHQSDRLRKGK